jgi:hypothetical protein
VKITFIWTPSGSVNVTRFTVCDTFNVTAPAVTTAGLVNYQVNGEQMVQEAKFFRAIARQFYARGNEKTVVTFEVSWGFPDIVTAEAWLNFYNTKYPRQCLVQFTSSYAGKSANAYLQNAITHPAQSRLKGCTTYHTHRVEGGIMSLTAQ